MKYISLIFIALVLFPAMASADQLRDDVEHALNTLETSTRQLEEHDPQSGAGLSESAALLAAVIHKYDLHTPGIYHALGNAYMLNNDLGHAVLAYRRGEELDPTNIQLKDSLAQARSFVGIDVKQNTTNQIWTTLLSWRGYIPRGLLWAGFLGLSTLGWLACSARILGLAPRAARIAGIWFIFVSLIPISMLGTEWIRYQGSSDAVIIDPNVIAMSGPNDKIYDPVFVDPLEPGVESRVIESRDGWYKLALPSGTQYWAPQSSVERVNP